MSTITKILGIATAYGFAKSKGYAGTEEEFAQEMADLAGISAEAETLEPDDEATASYSGGVLSFGIPKGDKGDTGETGATGATGNGIASIAKTATVGLVDTYTITFTDGTTTTFDVTNGRDGHIDNIDPTLTISGYAADAKAVGDKISEVKDAFTALGTPPTLKNTTASDVDLDIADESGNVLMRLSDGHISTKNFDSSELATAFAGKQDVLTFDDEPTEDSENPVTSGGVYDALSNIEITQDVEIIETEETEPDLDISDSAGNVIGRFSDGGFIVKQFDGRKYTTYEVTDNYHRQSLTLSINKSFKKGDKVVLHVEYGAKSWEYGAPVKYYEGSKEIADLTNGDSGYLEHIVTADCNSISAVYTSSAFSRTLDLTFEVSVLGDVPIEPTIVTIKADGTGDYTNLKDCLAAIGTNANDVLNPYRIEIYPATYDVLDDYTNEEIANIHDDDDPNSPSVQEGFVGPKLLNGMSLVGIGNPSEIILNGYLDTTQWAKKYRSQISTLNMQGSSSIENLTVIATNLRYCVHDDFQFNGAKHLKRLVKNCVFRGYNIAYVPQTTYGAGCPISAGYYDFVDCDFGSNAGLHASSMQQSRLQCRLVNCKGLGFRIGDSTISSALQPGFSTYTFINCDFLWIKSYLRDTESHARVMGICGRSALYDLPIDMLYDTGDVVVDPRTDLSMGDVVEWYADTEHGPQWKAATSADTAHGIVVFVDDTDAYIQVSGYVRTDRAGITTFSLGDYVTVSSGRLVITNNASDAVGRIAYINNDGDGFIKLDWRE